IGGPDKEANRCRSCNRFVQDRDLFGQKAVRQHTHAGEVAPRLVEAFDKAELDRIAPHYEYDRNRGGDCARGKRHAASSGGDNHRSAALNKFGNQIMQTIIAAIGPASFDPNRLTLNKPPIAKTLAEFRKEIRKALLRAIVGEPDNRQRRRLCESRTSPRCPCATDKGNECASVHCLIP